MIEAEFTLAQGEFRLSASFHDGGIISLSGENGAGKSTFLNALAGFAPLQYAGVEPRRLNVRSDLRQAFQAALDQTNSDETLYVLPTYTAMLALRQVIHQHFRPDGEMRDLVWK